MLPALSDQTSSTSSTGKAVPRVFADMPTMWFEFQRTTFRVDDGDDDGPATHTVRVLDSPTEELLETYAQWQGHTKSTLGLAQQKWGRNEFRIPMPKFMDLLQEHATAPFFVFQVFCVLLWMLDDNWMYSVFTLAMLVIFECLLVHQRMTNLRTLRGMRRPPQPIWVYRHVRGWSAIAVASVCAACVRRHTRCSGGWATDMDQDLQLAAGAWRPGVCWQEPRHHQDHHVPVATQRTAQRTAPHRDQDD